MKKFVIKNYLVMMVTFSVVFMFLQYHSELFQLSLPLLVLIIALSLVAIIEAATISITSDK